VASGAKRAYIDAWRSVRRLLLRSAVNFRVSPFAPLAFGLVAVAGCGHGASQGSDESAGISGQALVISPGVTVASATYTVTGPNGFTSAGSVPVGSSPDLSVVLNGLPIATGYEMDVFATASDGVTTCEATSSFDVTGASTTIPVHLVCGVPAGDVTVTGTVNVCPVLDGLDALPTEALLGGHAVLSASAHDADNGPSPLTYKWTINGAPLGNHPQPTLTFTCTSPGAVTIKVAISDGDPDAACGDSLAATVTCTGP
jgi:hypothetical protein